MRATGGVSRLSGLSPGDHVGWVVSSPAEYETFVRACVDDAASARQKAFLFGPESTLSDVMSRAGGFHCADPRSAFLDGSWDPQRMFDAFRDESSIARSEGYDGLRVLADMDWLLPVAPGPDDVMTFELLLDQLIAEIDATVVCAYRRGTFAAPAVAYVMAVHPLELGTPEEDLGFRLYNVGRDSWELRGEIDFFSGPVFERALKAVATSASSLTLSLRQLRFIDVAGLRVIAAMSRSVPITLLAANMTVRRCWRLLGFDQACPSVRVMS